MQANKQRVRMLMKWRRQQLRWQWARWRAELYLQKTTKMLAIMNDATEKQRQIRETSE